MGKKWGQHWDMLARQAGSFSAADMVPVDLSAVPEEALKKSLLPR